eukprot:jgi/Psemu1/54581/gm1.54581_g
MATHNFYYPCTPTSVKSAASSEDRFDRMSPSNSTPGTMYSLDRVPDSGMRSPASNNVIEEASVASSSSGDMHDNKNGNIENGIAFVKSQAALNQTYRNQRSAYKKLPLKVRKMTGINLQNIRPLAVRKGELC